MPPSALGLWAQILLRVCLGISERLGLTASERKGNTVKSERDFLQGSGRTLAFRSLQTSGFALQGQGFGVEVSRSKVKDAGV